MIAFTTTSAASTSLRALLGASVTTTNLQATVFYHDVLRQVRPDDSPYQTVPQYASLAGTAEVSICDAPNTDVNRFIDGVVIYNADTVAATVTVFLDDGTNRLMIKKLLAVGQSLIYEPGSGWQVV